MRRVINEATKGSRRAQRTFVKVAKPAEAWLGDVRPNIFWLIDSEYKDKPESCAMLEPLPETGAVCRCVIDRASLVPVIGHELARMTALVC